MGGELLNSKSKMTRGGKIPCLVIMFGEKEVYNKWNKEISDMLVLKIIGHGNCQFRAISTILSGHDDDET